MAWLTVVAAGILEAGFTICLKLTHGFTRLATDRAVRRLLRRAASGCLPSG